jgi:Flp pilus assembly protein TadB
METALKVVLAVAALAAQALGLTRWASRRNRLVNRIRSYVQLADDLEAHDPEGAALVRDLAKPFVRQLVEAERKSAGRRLDWAAVATWLLLVGPAVGFAVWAWMHGEWWKWLALVFSALWALIWSVAAWTQLWKPHEAEVADEGDRI